MAALNRAFFKKRLLNGVQFSVFQKSLRGYDLSPLNLFYQD
jgi:hypothetical protein